MPGASISRWTMAYFAAALAFFATALALMGSGFGLPSAAAGDPDRLVVVHLVAIGWLGLLFCGALLQFVPVLAATHLRLPRLAAPALVSIVSGLLMLVAGFLALGGRLDIGMGFLSLGAALLATGFAALIGVFAATVLSQASIGVSGLLVLAGVVALAVTVTMGAAFAGLLSGVLDAPYLLAVVSFATPYHAASGTLGWMTLTAIGVSYRLFAMFMLSPEEAGSGKPVALFAAGALVALYLALAAGMFGDERWAMALPLAIALALGVLFLYMGDVWRMFRARRRRRLELNSVAGLTALPFLALGMAVMAVAVSVDTSVPLATAAFYLLGLGWLSGLGLAQLYKIVPFLTWLETYGGVMGRAQVPRVQDLVDESRARPWFAAYYLAVGVGAAAILLDADTVFRAACWCQCASVIALAGEYVRARRLTYAPVQTKLPPGTVPPHLICANIASKE